MIKTTRARSIAKSLIWRIIATLTTVLFVYIFTGDLKMSFSVGSLEMLAKLVFYYYHERAWANIKWGIVEQNNL